MTVISRYYLIRRQLITKSTIVLIIPRPVNQDKVISFVRTKTSLEKDYYEFSYRFGHIELLATCGCFGEVDWGFFEGVVTDAGVQYMVILGDDTGFSGSYDIFCVYQETENNTSNCQ
ncbi:hypothetical protein EDC94DRAFT_647631 [Helicostylum pulchrum]|nr:hypothetical protein EDC94DRAFT_647631 [Helicostylum pulchrum]